ncbi:methyltransferase domain-containing protein [Conexibacter sp. W3-3-2]|uniref:class I SAM-dependent methyltransferase n=1 Tax=Conexibacter sp. W3-3-2 TaxID=2675227 RepID=UPI0012B7EB75|nr:class I SAM-dependent methyltransferase [Conexibacter sp. W3-3-2]MTD45716.1 methyltransferase domain-containing protein [Conexibacter sp. W3-3-2]
MAQIEDLEQFYEDCYVAAATPQDAERARRWRALSAGPKADHVMTLCRRAKVTPATVADVGCGDGAMLAELARRRFGTTHVGFELSSTAVEIARNQPGVAAVHGYDGRRLPAQDGAFDLGILSHVIEHVPHPAATLRETARVCRAVVVEVPLENNVSAGRPVKRAHAEEIGHLHRFDRAQVDAFVAEAGLRVVARLSDPLPLAVHTYFATTPVQRAAGTAKWAMRAGLGLVPAVGERLVTVHHAVLCVPAQQR